MDNNLTTGKRGEQLARDFLLSRGYVFVAANVRCRAGEIDLIMTKDATTLFIEVKTRRQGNSAGSGNDVGRWKWERMQRAIDAYLEVNEIGDWACLLVTVTILPSNKLAKISVLDI